MRRIYLDNAASAPLNKKVIKMLHRTRCLQGNPQGMHTTSLYNYGKLIEARHNVACALGCNDDEIFFCSGATEANQFAKTLWNIKSDKKVHDSLISNGRGISIPALSYINNETGKFDGEGVLFGRLFLDITATIGHIHIELNKFPQIFGASFSGHKFGALQGIGVLYINREQQKILKNKLPKSPWSFGGGTPNVLGIYSLGIAIKDACDIKQMAKRNNKIEKMIYYIADECVELGLKVECNTHIVNITFNSLKAMSAVSIFSAMGVDISAGSACHSNSDEPSRILLENGYSPEEALNTIRVSLSDYNTWLDIKRFVKILKKIVAKYDNL